MPSWRLGCAQDAAILRTVQLEMYEGLIDCHGWIVGPADVMRNQKCPCHHNVDISTPTDMIVLSVDKYLNADWLNNPIENS